MQILLFYNGLGWSWKPWGQAYCVHSILSHSSLCQRTPMAQLERHEPDWSTLTESLVFAKPWTWNQLNPRSKPKRCLTRSTYKSELSFRWMHIVSREVTVRITDHDRPLSCFGFCFLHLQARCCKPVHCDLIFHIQWKTAYRSTWVTPIA